VKKNEKGGKGTPFTKKNLIQKKAFLGNKVLFVLRREVGSGAMSGDRQKSLGGGKKSDLKVLVGNEIKKNGD